MSVHRIDAVNLCPHQENVHQDADTSSHICPITTRHAVTLYLILNLSLRIISTKNR